MSTQDGITNAVVRHQIFVQRFGANIGNKTAKALSEIQKLAERRLLNPDLTDFQRDRLQVIANDMQEQYRLIMGENIQDRFAELEDFARYEAEFTQGIMQTNIAGSTVLPNPEQISAAIDMARMEVGRQELGIRQIFKGFTDRAAKQVAQQISDGAILGETNQQITNRLQQLNGLHKNQAMTITRTVTNNISAIARDEVMRANEDVLDGYEWVAALDNRTTLICASRDGKVYSFSDPDAPRPPAHFNCRSVTIPKVKPEFDLGADVKTTRTARGADGAERIDSDTNYEAWLRRQPASFQDEVLGRERGKLFRGKKLKLERFVDDNGKPIPLDQLRVLDESFNVRAKVKPASAIIPKQVDNRPLFNGVPMVGKADAVQADGILKERLTPQMLAVVQKAEKPSLISTTRSGVYVSSDKSLFAGSIDKKKAVFSHEYGHHIDYVMNNKYNANKLPGKLKPMSEVDEGFRKAFDADRRKLFGDSFNNFAVTYKSEFWEGYKKRANSRYTYYRPKSHKDGDFEASISDIIDSMAGGRLFSDYYLSGHGKKYYKSYQNQATEVFANLFALRNDKTEVGERARKYFPNLFARFDEMLEEYVKGDYD
jgi:SPP1 gp7 family putative phage head morphogenesis protein